MTSKRTGNNSRKRCVDQLLAEGWHAEVVERTGRFIKYKDLFSEIGAGFDVIAIKPGTTLLVQVTTNYYHPEKPYKEFAKKYPQFVVMMMKWMKNKGFEAKIIRP